MLSGSEQSVHEGVSVCGMRTHRISAIAAKNRKHECFFCGKMVSPAKAGEFCPGKPEVKGKKR